MSTSLKYLLFDDCLPVIFHEGLSHATIAEGYISLPTSAGFCSINVEDQQVYVWGKSESLGGLHSQEDDSIFLTKFIFGQ